METVGAVVERTDTTSGGDAEGFVHTVCNKFPDLALCGMDMSERDTVDPDTPTECVVCDDLEERYMRGLGCSVCHRAACYS